ncbi:hypothetical protein Cni_G26516 [Canna indica]|uniref:Clp R domain-containing protein n=1 Tax=Canna indica TaxID=4628 RepID=A0AAQ3L370_9LILI|nr:hypothetical protein Cni_G26516 [Canna indica]
MRGGCAVQQSLTPEALTVVRQAVGLAQQRGHAQVTPLHVASIMLSSPAGLLRGACLQSHSHPLRCKALELCFNVALNRLPTSSSSSSLLGSYHHHHPALSNALMAAFKRAQAHQRRGSIEIQQQPLLVVKIELQQLIVSILDDPSVSRVMREAGFSSTQVKSNIEKAISLENCAQPCEVDDYYSSPLAKKTRSSTSDEVIRDEEIDGVMDSLVRGRKSSVVIVGENLVICEAVLRRMMQRVASGEVPEALRSLQFTNISLSSFESSSKEKVEEKIKELSFVVKGRSTVIYLGDMKHLADGFKVSTNGDDKEGTSYCPLEHAIMELGRLVSNGVEGDESGSGRIWVVGIATYQTYMSCISLGNLDVQPLFLPAAAAGSLELSLSFNRQSSRRKVVGAETSWRLQDRARKKSYGCAADNCCGIFQGPQNTVNGGHGAIASSLPPWLQKMKEDKGGISTNNPLNDLCKWSTNINSAKKHHYHQSEKRLKFSWSFPSSSSLHHGFQQMTGSEKESYPEFNFWSSTSGATQNKGFESNSKDHEEQMSSNSDNKHCSSTDSMEVEYTSKFKELSALNLKTLCNAMEEQVPWHKDIIPDIASTVLQCRSGMRKRKETKLELQETTKKETWLFFQGGDFEGKVKIAMELARLVFGSYTNFISVRPHELEKFSEAVRENPHRVILMEDIEQVDCSSQEGIESAIGRGRIQIRSSGEEVNVGDAIIIFTCESFGASEPRSIAMHGEEGEDDKGSAQSFVLDLNVSAVNGEMEDWALRISELVDRTFLLNLPQNI